MNVRAWLERWRGGGSLRRAVQARAAAVIAEAQARDQALAAKHASVAITAGAAKKTITTQLRQASAAIVAATPPPPPNGVAHA